MANYIVLNARGKYKDDKAIQDVIHYAVSKALESCVFGGAVLPEIAIESMKGVARAYHKERGVRLRHFVLSFDSHERITLRHARIIMQQVIAYYQDNYQILAAIHDDQENLHIHFIMNSVSYRDGSKYKDKGKDHSAFLNYLNKILRRYGISVHDAKKQQAEQTAHENDRILFH